VIEFLLQNHTKFNYWLKFYMGTLVLSIIFIPIL